ncbi:hypothetical protein [Dulcicalothrix desertica]|uniref:hypothetical protein n=1 Tax=Dulcicalothrix desertica TaxID=32056 RepID=UPI00119B4585|nr:hypothetical protein [Dulcicalothrix desertica]TWH53861.1 hypothetical protein CAL7102_01853 [Dulcicalothrix desertica PCC 7102]
MMRVILGGQQLRSVRAADLRVLKLNCNSVTVAPVEPCCNLNNVVDMALIIQCVY